MKKLLFALFALSTLFVGCQKSEVDSSEISGKKMQTVTLSATMPENDDTRAAISSTGLFSWQENDQLSVLATDGKFYTLTLTSGAGDYLAEFAGEVPHDVAITTVAMYPAVVANGTDNTIYDSTTGVLNYTLPTEYTFVPESTNVPMIASLEEGATKVSFKQIGGVIRFPLSTMLPAQAKIVFTAKDMVTTGSFPIAVENAGVDAIEATVSEGTNSTVTVNYVAEKAGVTADINIPVPAGTYKNFSIEVFDANNESVFAKDYELNKEIKRATLLLMNTVDAGPMTISAVWPYFVDARVLFNKFSGASAYAFYIDGSEEPVILDAEEIDGNMQAVIGGEFEHGSTHTVAVAKVYGDVIDEASKSEAVTFKTGNVMQMTYNTGTKFVCAGWDDVAIGVENSTQYVNGRWTAVPKNDNISGRNMRGYRVQLYAEDKTTLLYDEVPFSGQCDYGGAFANSSWFGKIGAENILLPTSLTFGWLEPGKKYYFRVQTLAEPVVFNSPENGNFEPGTAGYTVYSTRGGSAWSNLVEMTTDSEYMLGANDIMHEGFDDMLYNGDFMNMSPAAAPQVLTAATAATKYEGRDSAAKQLAWLQNELPDRKFSEQGFSVMLSSYELGITDDAYKNKTTGRVMNEYAGSLKGWSVFSNKESREVFPGFGVIRLGQSGSNVNVAEIRTAPINSDKLSDSQPTKCIVTVKVSSAATAVEITPTDFYIEQYSVVNGAVTKMASYKDNFNIGNDLSIKPEWSENYTFTDTSNYLHIPTWFEVKTSLWLTKGDVLAFGRTNDDIAKGMIVVGDVKIEIDPSATARVWGTAPDATNYDVWGMGGAMPVTFWMGPPVLDQFNADITDAATLASIKSTYFDPIVEGGYNLIEVCNPYPASMKVMLDWCQEAGVRMIDKSTGSWFSDEATINAELDRLANYASHASYGGAFVGPDEPGFNMYNALKTLNNAYASRFPGKGRAINLLPSYATKAQLNNGASENYGGSLLISSYSDYVQGLLSRVSINCLMLDHYCLKKSDKYGAGSRGNVKSKQYYDLDVARSKTLAKRIPYLMITHGRPQWDPGYSATIANTDPTWTTDVSATALPPKPDAHVYDEQRWLVWSQLALGSKGVSYFCYWTPAGFKGGPFSYHYDGTKTRMYDILKNVNAEIQPIGKILMTCHADGAMITNPDGNFIMYENSGVGLSNYGPVLDLTNGNSEDVVAGCFRDATTGEYKVLVTHKAPATTDDEAATASIATLTLDRAIVSKVKLHTVTLSNGHEAAATTVVSEVNLSDNKLTLTIPDGTAILVEFPETAGQTYN